MPRRRRGNVFPTGVGMNRTMAACRLVIACVPHRRGDEPMPCASLAAGLACSPQAWG